jgi:hypothetical protein
MDVGHLAVGLASKRWAPRTSLAWLVMAPIFADLLWGAFVLAGIEKARITPGITRAMPLDLEWIPISHSLVADVGWALLVAAIYFALRKDLKVAAILAVGVLSHWVLDVIAHHPDMPVLPSGPKLGFGLWNHPLAGMLVEAALVVIGALLYLSTVRARDRRGKIGFAILIAVLLVFNAGAYFGPPPTNITAPAVGNLVLLAALWLLHRIDARFEPLTA